MIAAQWVFGTPRPLAVPTPVESQEVARPVRGAAPVGRKQTVERIKAEGIQKTEFGNSPVDQCHPPPAVSSAVRKSLE